MLLTVSRALALCVALFLTVPVAAQTASLSVEGTGTYTISGRETRSQACRLARYEAQRNAVLQAVRELTKGEGLEPEAVSLLTSVARERVVTERWLSEHRPTICEVEVRMEVSSRHLVRAQQLSERLEAEEEAEAPVDMEPTGAVHPSRILASVYHDLEAGRASTAMRTLSTVLELYPNWSGGVEAQGDVLRGQHMAEEALALYRRACELGNERACAKAARMD
jgi:hypothetical protein